MTDAPDFYEELRRRKCEQPFRPFEIEASDGTRYKVSNRWAYAGNHKVLGILDRSDVSTRLLISKIKAIKDVSRSAH